MGPVTALEIAVSHWPFLATCDGTKTQRSEGTAHAQG